MNCGRRYEDDSEELLKGCVCGSTLFLYEKDPEDKKNKKPAKKKDALVEEIDNFLKNLKKKLKRKPEVRFDLESIKVVRDGIYEINIARLLEKLPLIIEIKDGSYNIHLPSAFKQGRFETFDIKELEDEKEIKGKVKTKKRKKRR